MSTIQNVINANSSSPLPTLQGGSGISSPVAHGVLVSEGASAFNPIVLAAGNVLIGTTASDPVSASLSAGSGISISSVSGSITISNSAAALTWVDQTSTPVNPMLTNHGYLNDNGATQGVYTLPTSASINDMLWVVGKGSGGWIINQAASQQILFGNQATTAGTGGSLASSLQYDNVHLLCLTGGATSTWTVLGAVGNLTVT